jgi:hypothetical protein
MTELTLSGHVAARAHKCTKRSNAPARTLNQTTRKSPTLIAKEIRNLFCNEVALYLPRSPR